jgi:hypothetical protein
MSKMSERHGCSDALYKHLLSIGRSLARRGIGRERQPIGAYIRQRQNAQRRGIEWNISLGAWWQIWEESGKWWERGRGDGFVMARKGDEGAYEVGNVYICWARVNNSEANKRDASLPMGVIRTKEGTFAARSMIDGKITHIGTYKTPDDAELAYRIAISIT